MSGSGSITISNSGLKPKSSAEARNTVDMKLSMVFTWKSLIAGKDFLDELPGAAR